MKLTFEGSCSEESTFTVSALVDVSTVLQVSFIAVAMNSRDQYEIVGLRKISHFIKQPCRNVSLEKAL